MYDTLIHPLELQRLMDSGKPLRVFDCSFELMDPAAGHRQYLEAHLPGAHHADLEHDLSTLDPALRVNGGRHPLPQREVFLQWIQRMGVHHDTQVVVYDRQGMLHCGRLWWMLQWCGHAAVAVLDGGLAGWQAAGGAVVGGEEAPPAESGFALRPPLVKWVDTATVAQGLSGGQQVLIDARATPRFRGEVEPLDPVAGHIPGALNRPYGQNIASNGCFKPAAELRAEFEALLAGRSAAHVIHHCGSGVSAIPNILGMRLAGLGTPALYAGSWSEWCNTPGLPVARGD
jgi:thiosulfate/3-mercaptopyruvate sulfurtransferase